ncbi:hypothetical protein BX616_010352 [Lobosporangium transversale]|nr:hypothetical protein BX616_010352 [Lobosporangium transversale]
MPIILQILRTISVALTPLASILRGIPVLGKVTNGSIKLVFWTWFIILMMSDVLLRRMLKIAVGLHEPSAGQYSTVNACDTNFQPCGEFGKTLDKEKVKRIEEGGQDFERDHDYDERKVSLKPRTSNHDNSKRSRDRPKSLDTKYKVSGRSGSDLASMSSEDWHKVLEMANIDKSRYVQDDIKNGFEKKLDQQQENLMDRPRYSQPIATTLAMVSKLVYEDVPVIRHELALSGYDMHSFRAIAYKNTCGFIVQKGRNIVLVFRGTDPLNLQNAWTDIQSRLIPIKTLGDEAVPLGKCHKGMYNALGSAENFLLPSEELAQQQRELSRLQHRRYSDTDMDEDDYGLHSEKSSPKRPHKISPASSFRSEVTKASTINLELSNHSVYQTIVTSIRAAYMLVKFLIVGLFTHVSDPVDYRFAGEVRDLSAFAQACRWLDGLRLEHAEKELKRMHKVDRSSKVSHQRRSSSNSRALSRRSSLSNLYSTDDIESLDISKGQDKEHGRRSSLSGHGSFRSAKTRRLSLTGLHHAGQSHHRRRLSGCKADSKDSAQWTDLGNKILDIYNHQYRDEQEGSFKRKKLRFYICGHSLGGALATIFLAKMVQCHSPLLDIFSGLYTYGSPKIGDKDFSNAFGPKLACKMFHHVYNNDIFARVPFWGAYETLPGTLVFVESSHKLILYPPDPVTLMPVPVRGISFMHLSGILNLRVIMRMRRESWLRIFERIVLPFFLNDHFPGDYVKALAEGKIEIVMEDTAHYGGVDEAETGSPVQTGLFTFFKNNGDANALGREKAVNETSSPLANRAHAVDRLVSRRSSCSNGVVTTTIIKPNGAPDMFSGDNDSGYGGTGDRSEDMDSSRVRRRIVKYTYHQEGDDDEEEEEEGYYRGNDSRRSKERNRNRDEGCGVEGDTRWRELASESGSEIRRQRWRSSLTTNVRRRSRQ